MPSTFETTFNTYALPAFELAFGVSVTISDGQDSTAAITVRRSDIVDELRGGEFAFGVKVRHREFFVNAVDIVINSATVVPQDGWIITEGSEQWQVTAMDGQPGADLLTGGYEYRLRCVRIL